MTTSTTSSLAAILLADLDDAALVRVHARAEASYPSALPPIEAELSKRPALASLVELSKPAQEPK